MQELEQPSLPGHKRNKMTQQKTEEKKIETPKTSKAPKEAPKTEEKPISEEKPEVKEEPKKDEAKEAPKTEEKTPETKEEKLKKPVKEEPKKDESTAIGKNLSISKKQSMYICNFIKNKHIDKAIEDLELVTQLKKVVPFKGEIPHRKGKGMMSGRYPQKAAKLFIGLLKGLKGNVTDNNMDLGKTRIYIASASWARRPQRSNNRQGKRTNVILKAKEIGGKN